jgi:putative addiction module killer protein
MVEVVKSATFDRWVRKLKDRRAAARVLVRIDRLAAGNSGDVKSVGGGISELRIDHGPGYRGLLPARRTAIDLAALWRRQVQSDRDIEQAHRIAEKWRNDEHVD